MKRIQCKRTKGWKMPPNTVYVGRPTKWGNPYKIGEVGLVHVGQPVTREEVLYLYEKWVKQEIHCCDSHFLDPLKGKDLACWCPLDKPCHADVLLKFLEEGGVESVTKFPVVLDAKVDVSLIIPEDSKQMTNSDGFFLGWDSEGKTEFWLLEGKIIKVTREEKKP